MAAGRILRRAAPPAGLSDHSHSIVSEIAKSFENKKISHVTKCARSYDPKLQKDEILISTYDAID